MTDRELMQQALDALETVNKHCFVLADYEEPMEKAIEVLRARLSQPNDFNPDWDAMAVMVEEQQRMAKRIEELEARLAEGELKPTDKTGSPCAEFWDWLPKAYRDGDKGDEPKFTKFNMEVAYLAGKQSLAQGEPEPVAWLYDWYDETEDIDGVPIGGIFHDWISKDYDEAHSPTMGCHNIRPLYTAPPQRGWQGLTDDELTALHYYMNGKWTTTELVRHVEAKIKEKNASR